MGDAAVVALVDAIEELLHSRAQSIGAIDVAIEANDGFVDGELLFAIGAGVGFALDLGSGECRYCELVGEDAERWLDGVVRRTGDPLGRAQHEGVALAVLDGVLEARRSLRP